MRTRSFNRSTLVRQLAAWQTDPSASIAGGPDVAERLADWLNVADAITLHAAHQSLPAVQARPLPRGTALPGPQALQTELQRARETLAYAAAQHDADVTDHEFALVHQHVLDVQRRMDLRIDALRNHVRQVLAAASPELARLAALDAVLEQLLHGREQHLLSTGPAFLKARFAQLRQAAEPAAPDDAAPADPSPADVAQARAARQRDLHALLLAELELRLQPVTGMIEAYAQAFPEPLDAPERAPTAARNP